jgi:hypothetical protein
VELSGDGSGVKYKDDSGDDKEDGDGSGKGGGDDVGSDKDDDKKGG